MHTYTQLLLLGTIHIKACTIRKTLRMNTSNVVEIMIVIFMHDHISLLSIEHYNYEQLCLLVHIIIPLIIAIIISMHVL